MKTRESGMPDEAMWAGFFDPLTVLNKLALTGDVGDVIEFGCGYGTFTLPAARIVGGIVHALDIDPAMVACVTAKAQAAGMRNLRPEVRDIVREGTGLSESTVDYAMMFNILHAECPDMLLREAYRVLRPGGRMGIMHWNYDPTTPRGPSMAIRPRPEQCRQWAERAGFHLSCAPIIDLPPYHYGIVLTRPASGLQGVRS